MASFREQFDNWRFLRSWRPYFVIFVLGFMLYGRTLTFDYTYFDDSELILGKTAILQDMGNIGRVFSTDVFFSGGKFYYRPLLNLSFMLDTQLSGQMPFFFHLSNILIHILAAALLYCFLKKISGKPALSFFLALVFLVHPVLTQAVAWIPGRNDSLLAVFVLAAFISFFNFSRRPRFGLYLMYLFFFFCALLTKETAAFLPVLIALYFWFIDRKAVSATDKFLLLFGSAAVGFIWFLLRSLALDGNPADYISALGNMIKCSPALLLGLGKLVLPANLSVLPILEDSNLLYGIIVFIALALACLFSRQRRGNYLFFGLAWFLLFLLPSFLCFDQSPDFLEHRLYLPLIGFMVMLMEIDWIKNLNFSKKSVKAAAVIIILIFSLLTWRQSYKFSDRLTFWQTAEKDSPHSPLAARNLGAMYYLDRQPDLAIKYYRRALELNPTEAMAHNNIGLIYMEAENYSQAEREFKKELGLYPDYDKALFNLGLLYYRTGRADEAKIKWQQALKSNPYYYDPYYYLLNLSNRLR